MPETSFAIRWPDGGEQSYYSPSLVVHEHLPPGAVYEVAELLQRAGAAMTEASDRVQARFGFPCTRSMASLQQVQAQAARYAPDRTATVLGGP